MSGLTQVLNYSFDFGVEDLLDYDMWRSDLIDDETLSQLATTAGPLLDDIDDDTLTQLANAAGPLLDDDDSLVFSSEASTSRPTQHRFATATSTDDINGIIKSTESKQTRKSTTWAVKVFEEWRNARNQQAQAGNQLIPALNVMTAQQLNTHLSHFILEARRQDGSEYPGKTLYCIMTGILRFLREQGCNENFLDR
jgi:hypothetical protein